MELDRDAHDMPVASPWALQPRWGVTLLLLLLPALLLLEWTAGRAFSLYLFYLCPVALAAWNFGYRIGFAIATLAAAYCIFVALTLATPGTPMEPLALQGVSILAMFMLFAFVIAHHRRFVDNAVSAARTDLESGTLARREFHRVLHSEAWRANRYHRPLALVLLEAEGWGTRAWTGKPSTRSWAKLCAPTCASAMRWLASPTGASRCCWWSARSRRPHESSSALAPPCNRHLAPAWPSISESPAVRDRASRAPRC